MVGQLSMQGMIRWVRRISDSPTRIRPQAITGTIDSRFYLIERDAEELRFTLTRKREPAVACWGEWDWRDLPVGIRGRLVQLCCKAKYCHPEAHVLRGLTVRKSPPLRFDHERGHAHWPGLDKAAASTFRLEYQTALARRRRAFDGGAVGVEPLGHSTDLD
jgi:hypothetical protein